MMLVKQQRCLTEVTAVTLDTPGVSLWVFRLLAGAILDIKMVTIKYQLGMLMLVNFHLKL
jgi:hypothetical protein